MKTATSKPTYTSLWRNKWITSDAKSLDDMIKAYTSAISHFQDLKSYGKEIEFDFGAAGDDYIHFSTKDADIAEKFGMEAEIEEDY